jgi:formylglycine-generating enzyme required for sulfatase activity
VNRDCPVIPVLLPNAPTKPELPVFLRQFTWVDFRKSDPDPMYRLRWGITGKKPDQQINFKAQTNPVAPTVITEILPKGILLEMIKIPAGSFLMGTEEAEVIRLCKEYETDWYKNEMPQHRVNLQEFYLGKYPVTQEQYQAIMGNNPSYFRNNPKNPVENVGWNDAQEFCQKLSEKTGKKYRLPNESEWEYACRAGTQTHYYFGDDEKVLGEYAWYGENSESKTHPVGQKKPNDWGLYDMSGNVCEWCEDSWHDNYQKAPTDGTTWNGDQNDYRVLRGGSWGSYPGGCRSPYRSIFDYSFINYGFRVVSPQDS